MQRVFLPAECFQGPSLDLPPDTGHYLTSVLRLGPGAEFLALSPTGAEYRVCLDDPPTSATLLEQLPARPETGVALTLYQGLPRGKRFPLILQKATELGVARIVAVTTARSQVRLTDRETPAKLGRWGKICAEAAEQCLRPRPPELIMAHSWSEALSHWQDSGQPGLLLDETLAGETGQGLGPTLQSLGKPSALAAFLGPEGGFSPQEAASGRTAGLLPVALGPRILRAETAALVVSALVMYEYGELG